VDILSYVPTNSSAAIIRENLTTLMFNGSSMIFQWADQTCYLSSKKYILEG
jgi:hypothetical protein